MIERDSAPDELRMWRAAGVPVDDGRRDACRPGAVAAIARGMERARRTRARQRAWRWVLAAALVGASGVGGYALVARSGAGTIEAVQPTVTLPAALARATHGTADVSRSGTHHALSGALAMALDPGDVVRVGAQSALIVELPDAGLTEWQAGSELEVRAVDAHHQGFALRQGRVAVTIPTDSPPRQLVVSTPHVDVVVVGTVFDVAVFADGEETISEVYVQRGIVEVRRQGRQIARLNAGQSWSSRERHERATAAAEEARPRGPAKGPPAKPDASTLAEQNRLYRAALDARNAGDDDRTVALLTQLLTAYPASPLAQEAKVERFRALERLGRTEEARRAARSYLAEHGDGFARDEARSAALGTAPPGEKPPVP